MPIRIVTISTETGTFPSTNGVDFGDQYKVVSYSDNSTVADRDVGGTVEGTIGGSPKWSTLLTLTTDSSGTRFASTGADLVPFDKLRIVISANNSTADVIAWLGASD